MASRSELAAAYAHDHRVSQAEAGRIYGVGQPAVSVAARKLGISNGSGLCGRPRKWFMTEPLVETGSRCVAAANDVIRGMAVKEAAVKHGLSAGSIYSTLRCPPISALVQR